MTMTAKDKKLIIMAGAALIALALIMFGIKPAITGFSDANAKKAELQAKKTSMETEINNLPSYKTQLEAAKGNYKTTADRVFGDLTSDKIHDAVVNELVTPCGLSITNFTIESVDKADIGTYTIAASETTGDNVGTGGIQQKDGANIRLATISASVFGTSDQVIALLDTLNNDEGTYLIQSSFQNSAEGTSATVKFAMVLSETF